jgi:hypothetical protein
MCTMYIVCANEGLAQYEQQIKIVRSGIRLRVKICQTFYVATLLNAEFVYLAILQTATLCYCTYIVVIHVIHTDILASVYTHLVFGLETCNYYYYYYYTGRSSRPR